MCTCEHCSCAAHAPHPTKKSTPFVGVSRHEESFRAYTDEEIAAVKHKKKCQHAQAESTSCPWNKGSKFEGEAQSRSAFQAPPPEARPKSYKELLAVDPRAETDTRRTADEIAKHKFTGGTLYQEQFKELPLKNHAGAIAQKMKGIMTCGGRVQGPWGIQTGWKVEGTTATRAAHREWTAQEQKDAKPPKGNDLRFDSGESPWQHQSDQGFYQGASTAKSDYHAFDKEALLVAPAQVAKSKEKMKGDCNKWHNETHAWTPHTASYKDEMVTTYGREFQGKEKEEHGMHGKVAPKRDFWSAYQGSQESNHEALWFAGGVPRGGQQPAQTTRSVTQDLHRAFTKAEQQEGRPCKQKSLQRESANGPFECLKGATMEGKTVNQKDYAPPPREAYDHVGADKKKRAARQESILDEPSKAKEVRDFTTTSRGTHDKPQTCSCPAKQLLKQNPPPAPPPGREHVYYDEVARTWY
jgi:hypothetical protein